MRTKSYRLLFILVASQKHGVKQQASGSDLVQSLSKVQLVGLLIWAYPAQLLVPESRQRHHTESS
jgi:hypothetical protein